MEPVWIIHGAGGIETVWSTMEGAIKELKRLMNSGYAPANLDIVIRIPDETNETPRQIQLFKETWNAIQELKGF